jgi:hypothetical protein
MLGRQSQSAAAKVVFDPFVFMAPSRRMKLAKANHRENESCKFLS